MRHRRADSSPHSHSRNCSDGVNKHNGHLNTFVIFGVRFLCVVPIHAYSIWCDLLRSVNSSACVCIVTTPPSEISSVFCRFFAWSFLSANKDAILSAIAFDKFGSMPYGFHSPDVINMCTFSSECVPHSLLTLSHAVAACPSIVPRHICFTSALDENADVPHQTFVIQLRFVRVSSLADSPSINRSILFCCAAERPHVVGLACAIRVCKVGASCNVRTKNERVQILCCCAVAHS